jgi:DNA-binding transcriptional LysR family regulator
VLIDDRLVAGVAPGHPFASERSLRLATVCGQPLIALPRGTGLRACLDEACARSGLAPHVALEASSPGILAELAARELGVAILPESLAPLYEGRLVCIEIVRPVLRSRLDLAWRATGASSPAARALVEHARAQLAAALA